MAAKLNPLMAQGLIGWPRDYGGNELMGYEGFVASVNGGTATIVHHQLYGIKVEELKINDLHELFMPDLTRTPAQAARGFKSLRTFMKTPAKANELIDLHSKSTITACSKEFAVPTPAKAAKTAAKPTFVPHVLADVNRRTCIAVHEKDGMTSFIPLSNEGFDIIVQDSSDFIRKFKPIDYPVERAARLYVEYAASLGGTREALKALGQLTSITQKEIDMAATKSAERSAAKPAKKVVSKTAETASAKAPKPAAKAVKQATTKAAKPAGEKKGTAADMFRSLILAGKLTDDQIFAAVKKEFGLDDSKRGYVKWYRNDLIKKGEKVPEAK